MSQTTSEPVMRKFDNIINELDVELRKKFTPSLSSVFTEADMDCRYDDFLTDVRKYFSEGVGTYIDGDVFRKGFEYMERAIKNKYMNTPFSITEEWFGILFAPLRAYYNHERDRVHEIVKANERKMLHK